MRQYNIRLQTVSRRDFEGYILDSELTDDQLTALGLKRDAELINEVKVEGSFFIEWDDDIAMPQIETVYVVGALDGKTGKRIEMRQIEAYQYKSEWVEYPSHYEIELDVELCNYEAIEEEISQNDTGDWAADRIASKIDDAYDRYRDGD